MISVAALLKFAEREEWAVLVVGLWLLALPWVLGFRQTPAVRIDIWIGILVPYVAAIGLWLIHYTPASEPEAG